MFIATFSLCVALITFFGSLWPAVYGCLGALLCLLILGKRRRKCFSRYRKAVLAIILAFLLSIGAVNYKHARYTSSQSPLSSRFIGSGLVVEAHGRGRYILELSQGGEYLFYSPKNYEPGDSVYVTAFYQPLATNLHEYSKQDRFAWKEKLNSLREDERSFDYDKWLLMKGWAGTLYDSHSVVYSSRVDMINDNIDMSVYLSGDRRDLFVLSLRNRVLALVDSALSPDVAGLTKGMLIGDRSGLDKEQYQGFVDSGLVHIIAVSGGNIVLIVSFLLFFLPYYIRLFILSIAVLGYALLCGADSSVVRAASMALLSMAALFAGRILSVWRSMSIVYILMLLWNPYYLLYDLGFLFSFSALAGLVYFAKKRGVQQKKKRTVRSFLGGFWNVYILPTIAASLGIIVPLLFFTSRVNLLSTMSNLVIVPVVPFVMIYGFLASVVYSVTSRKRIVIPQQRLVSRIYNVSERTNAHGIVLSTQEWRARMVFLGVMIVIIVALRIFRKDKGMV